MFHLKNQKNTKQEQLKTILQWIDEAEAVVIGVIWRAMHTRKSSFWHWGLGA
ncbi:MAG: hypothetical protein HFH82_12395 [Lachnospiraceae bacterium]|nr:hypothetical protein [Lachnospiraceae bacterium]